MFSKPRLVWCLSVVLVVCFVNNVSGRRIYDDLEIAASDKHEEWKKGDGSDHHESGHEEKGEKGEKGYKSEHGYSNWNCIALETTTKRMWNFLYGNKHVFGCSYWFYFFFFIKIEGDRCRIKAIDRNFKRNITIYVYSRNEGNEMRRK